MRLKLTVPPATEPVTTAEAKEHLKVEVSDDDLLIATQITAARQAVEEYTRRALITQTWELTLDSAGTEIELPRPPNKVVSKIEVVDEAGNKSTVSPTLYMVDLGYNQPGRIRLKSGCSWPSHRGFASFIVTLICGFGDTAATIPAALRQAVFQILGHLYENRAEESAIDWRHVPGPLSMALRLMAPYKVYRL